MEVAKMQMNRQAQLGVLNAMIAADRNQVQGRGVDANLFSMRSQAWADREKLLQGERQRAATGQQFYDKLAADKALEQMRAANEIEKTKVPYGKEARDVARHAITLQAIAANPANAKAILDAIDLAENGTLTAPAGPIPGAPSGAVQTGPNYIQRFYHNLGALGPNIVTGAGDTWWDRFKNTKFGIRPELLGEYENSPYLGPLGVYNRR
ncbi:MAG TPA: hypothetical protein VFG68_19035 [Fimbriiglobus sp.]|nr:hypothetical protein [Fimbriiglobus sp.]